MCNISGEHAQKVRAYADALAEGRLDELETSIIDLVSKGALNGDQFALGFGTEFASEIGEANMWVCPHWHRIWLQAWLFLGLVRALRP